MNFCEALDLLKRGFLVTRECFINKKDSHDYYFVYIDESISPFPSIRAQSFDGKEIVSDTKADFNSFDILANDWVKYENKKFNVINKMKLYLLERKDDYGYDEYISCVVCAENEEEARKIQPDTYGGGWPEDIDLIDCTHIGEAREGLEKGVVHSSYNAG